MSALKNTIFFTNLLVIGFFAFSCGIKGPPLPPVEKTETVQTQRANETKAPTIPGANVSGDRTGTTETPAK